MIEKVEQQWLKTFHCVYENKSFKRSASFLNLPTSNVSRHISLLEKCLGIRLFERTTRKISATEAGKQLYNKTVPLLSQLDAVLSDVTKYSSEISGQFNILVPDIPELGQAVITFCKQYPELSLCCETSLSAKEDFIDGFDVIISFQRGRLVDSNWIANEIIRFESVVVASPQVLKTFPKLTTCEELVNRPCISSFTALHGNPWVFRDQTGNTLVQKVGSVLKVNSGQMAKSAAVQGLGFAILAYESCKNELSSGLLKVVEMEQKPEDLVLYAFYPSREFKSKKVGMFIQHLKVSMNKNAMD